MGQIFFATPESLPNLVHTVKVAMGDTVYLAAGDYGHVSLKGYGENTPMPAEPIHFITVGKVKLESLIITESSNVVIEGNNDLVITGDSPKPNQPLVGIYGNSCYLRRCQVVGESSSVDGVVIRGKHSSISHSEITHVHHGIQLRAPHAVAYGNQVEHCYGDHIRGLADHIQIINNTLRHSHLGNPKNHNDLIQLYSLSDENGQPTTPQRGVLKNVLVKGNLLKNDEQPDLIPVQGIGCFDGLLVDSEISDNTVFTNHELGIAISHDQNCTITGNTVRSTLANVKSRIHIGSTKPVLHTEPDRYQASIVEGNYAEDYLLHMACALSPRQLRPNHRIHKEGHSELVDLEACQPPHEYAANFTNPLPIAPQEDEVVIKAPMLWHPHTEQPPPHKAGLIATRAEDGDFFLSDGLYESGKDARWKTFSDEKEPRRKQFYWCLEDDLLAVLKQNQEEVA